MVQEAAGSAIYNLGVDLANRIGSQQEIDALNEIHNRQPEFTKETTEEEKKEWINRRH